MEISNNAINPGKAVRIEADTRAEAVAKVADIRKQASGQGLVEEPGGFVHYVEDGKDFLDPGKFVAELIFNKKQ